MPADRQRAAVEIAVGVGDGDAAVDDLRRGVDCVLAEGDRGGQVGDRGVGHCGLSLGFWPAARVSACRSQGRKFVRCRFSRISEFGEKCFLGNAASIGRTN